MNSAISVPRLPRSGAPTHRHRRDRARGGAVDELGSMSGGSVSLFRRMRLCHPYPCRCAGDRPKRSALGFAVLQPRAPPRSGWPRAAPIIDNFDQGKLIVGLGRGSSYNIYDYQGFASTITMRRPPRRSEHILVKAWTEERSGTTAISGSWTCRCAARVPIRTLSALIRGSSGDASLDRTARQGKPFLRMCNPSRRR